MGAVYKREIKSLMTDIYGFLLAAVVLLGVGMTMYKINLYYGFADASYNQMGWGEYALCLMIPLVCMKSVTGDRKQGTDVLYRTLPLSTTVVVLGKFFALLTVLALPIAVMSLYPLLLSAFGEVNFLSAYSAILLYFFLGAALIALCMFLSSLTRYMILSAIVGIAVCVLVMFAPSLLLYLPFTPVISLVGFAVLAALIAVAAWLFTKNIPATVITAMILFIPLGTLYVLDAVLQWQLFEGLLYLVASYVSPFQQFQNSVSDGLFDLFSVTVMVSFAVFFLFLTVRSMNRRRLS